MARPPAPVGDAYRQACRIELRALKPGNVHVHADGHGMTVADFEASCEASATAIGDSSGTVGQRILAAVRATRRAVGCNTNLGIVLLAAPLAQAAIAGPTGKLREDLRRILDSLTVDDAAAAFEAIRTAAPGGLGTAARHDVRHAPTVTLRLAMAEAAERDSIASQYVTAFADVFEFGLPTLRHALERWRSPEWAAAAVYMGFLARMPDSHVARKSGPEAAESLRLRAAPHSEELLRSATPRHLSERLMAFDAALKDEALNPGTSADLCVATIFASLLDQGCRSRITDLL